jgi:hypothetical protein
VDSGDNADQLNNLSEGLRNGEAISTAFMRMSCNPSSRHPSNWQTNNPGTTNAPRDYIRMMKNLQMLNRKASRELRLFSHPRTKVWERFPGGLLRELGLPQLYRHRQHLRRANRWLLRIPCRKILTPA